MGQAGTGAPFEEERQTSTGAQESGQPGDEPPLLWMSESFDNSFRDPVEMPRNAQNCHHLRR